jgi:hypothetical protein
MLKQNAALMARDGHDLSRDRPENAQMADVFGHNPKRPSRHENAGGYLGLGTAHDYRGGLHRPAFHQRSEYRSTGELSGFVHIASSWGTIAMLSVDQFLRLMCVPAVIFAFMVASQISAAVNPPPMVAMGSE